MQSPQDKDWNQFWNRSAAPSSRRPSWSKRRILQVLRPYVVSGKRALDAGCGSGFFTKFFCDQDMPTVAADYSKSALEMTHILTRGKSRQLRVDFLKEPLSEKLPPFFDLIFSDGLLEHFTAQQQDEIIKNWKTVMSPDGLMITFVPNRFSPWELIRPLYMPGIEETPFVLKELVDVHERNGLTVIQKGGINTLPFQFSPDQLLGSMFGMLLYVVAKRKMHA